MYGLIRDCNAHYQYLCETQSRNGQTVTKNYTFISTRILKYSTSTYNLTEIPNHFFSFSFSLTHSTHSHNPPLPFLFFFTSDRVKFLMSVNLRALRKINIVIHSWLVITFRKLGMFSSNWKSACSRGKIYINWDSSLPRRFRVETFLVTLHRIQGAMKKDVNFCLLKTISKTRKNIIKLSQSEKALIWWELLMRTGTL